MSEPESSAEDGCSVPVWIARIWLGNADFGRDFALLAADERARADRFIWHRDRARFVAARAFLRRTLADFVDLPAGGLSFAYSAEGRPRLDGLRAAPDFNLSHSNDVAFVAISWAGPVGIDVEVIRALEDRDGLARQVMHPTEQACFDLLPEARRTAAFFWLWTHKEALLKAWGCGFSADPRAFFVGLGPPGGTTDGTVGNVACILRDISVPGFAAAICAPEGTNLRRWARRRCGWPLGCKRENEYSGRRHHG